MEAMVDDVVEVVKDLLRNGEVQLPLVVHVKAHMLDSIDNVRSGEDEVLDNVHIFRCIIT